MQWSNAKDFSFVKIFKDPFQIKKEGWTQLDKLKSERTERIRLINRRNISITINVKKSNKTWYNNQISFYLNLEANIKIAQSLFKQNKYQETINTCNQILATDNNSIEAIKLISKSFLAAGKIEDSRSFLHKALNIKPDDYEVIKDLGNTYLAIGDSNTAKNYYKKAIEINSSYAPALTNFGSL